MSTTTLHKVFKYKTQALSALDTMLQRARVTGYSLRLIGGLWSLQVNVKG